MATTRKLLHCEVEMTENTTRIFTETMLFLYEKYKDRLGDELIDKGGKRAVKAGDSEQDLRSE